MFNSIGKYSLLAMMALSSLEQVGAAPAKKSVEHGFEETMQDSEKIIKVFQRAITNKATSSASNSKSKLSITPRSKINRVDSKSLQ